MHRIPTALTQCVVNAKKALRLAGASIKHEAAATRGVQIELLEQDDAHFTKYGLGVHALCQHSQPQKP